MAAHSGFNVGGSLVVRSYGALRLVLFSILLLRHLGRLRFPLIITSNDMYLRFVDLRIRDTM